MSPVSKMSGGSYYTSMSVGYVRPFTGDFYSIATATSASTATSYTFSDIPQDFKHLQIRGWVMQTGGAYSYVRFNNDPGQTYQANIMAVTSNTTYSPSAWTSGTTAIVGAYSTASATYPSYAIMDIYNYRDSTKFKNTYTRTGVANLGNASVVLIGGQWRSTDPITSITIFTDGTSWSANTKFSLYGAY